MTDWAPIIVTALASGGLGSVVTPYGTQTRERRQARAEAREAIRRVQELLYPLPNREHLSAALDNLETSVMLAGLPKNLTGLNREALYIRQEILASVAEERPVDDDTSFAVEHIADETLRLLIDATWHPILGAPYRWSRTRQLARVMDTRPRPGPRPRDKRRWERETIRRAKLELKQRRRT